MLSQHSSMRLRLLHNTSIRKVETNIDSVQLYQYAICPFCNRVKAFFNYCGVKYDAIEVNPLTKKEIKWSKDYRKVPIATINESSPLNGSDAIIDGLLARKNVYLLLQKRWGDSNDEGPKMTLETFQNESAQQWVQFANDELAPLLYPNMCRTLQDSYRAFGYVDQVEEFSPLQRLAIKGAGSLAMYAAASKVKKKRNIVDEREALDKILLTLENDGLMNGNKFFLSGLNEPNIGDISVFGTLHGIAGLTAHTEAVENRPGPIPLWYNRMRKKVEPNSDEI